MLRAFDRFFNAAPADLSVWHKWWTVFPVRLVTGRLSSPVGQTWRRQTATGWEYRQDAETDIDWLERQW